MQNDTQSSKRGRSKEALAKWNVLNPDRKRNYILFNQEQSIEFWNTYSNIKLSINAILQHYMIRKQFKYEKKYILAKLGYLFKSFLKELLELGNLKLLEDWASNMQAYDRIQISLRITKKDQQFERVQKNLIDLAKMCTLILEAKNEQDKLKQLVEQLKIQDFNQVIDDAAFIQYYGKDQVQCNQSKNFQKQTEKHEKDQQNVNKILIYLLICKIDSDSDYQPFLDFHNTQD